jgi:hypothetical protein
LFQPCVRAGLVNAGALAGYRNIPVYLRNSRHVPPRWEVVRDAMPALFDLLEQETEPGVRAVLGHWLFGYILCSAKMFYRISCCNFLESIFMMQSTKNRLGNNSLIAWNNMS